MTPSVGAHIGGAFWRLIAGGAMLALARQKGARQ